MGKASFRWFIGHPFRRPFPAVVTMDAHGRSLHQEVADTSKGRLQGILS